MNSITQKEITYLIENNNTGIEFEYALFYLLNPDNNKVVFRNEVIDKHIFKERIYNIVSNTNLINLNKILLENGWESYEVFLATQSDEIGPADIVLKNNERQLGLSVKYQNNCTLNVSSRYFLTDDNTSQLKYQLNNACESYINEMNAKYGELNNWFRKRKKSYQTNNFIDKIRDKLISDWSAKSIIERKSILSRLIHEDSPIIFYVIKFVKIRDKYILKIDINPIKRLDPHVIELKKLATSYIGFYDNEIIVAKMQVKFNNGILEKGIDSNYDIIIDGVKIKMGDPFGSWNFSI